MPLPFGAKASYVLQASFDSLRRISQEVYPYPVCVAGPKGQPHLAHDNELRRFLGVLLDVTPLSGEILSAPSNRLVLCRQEVGIQGEGHRGVLSGPNRRRLILCP